jgi:hypothetical protein
MIEIEILLTFVYFLECTAVQCKDALSVYFHHTCLRPPLYIATGYQESLFVGWKVYSSSTNKANIYSYSIFVQQMYWLQDTIYYSYPSKSYHRYDLWTPPLFFFIYFITFVWRFHYKQYWTSSNITKNSIRDRYKPISKNTKTLDPLL